MNTFRTRHGHRASSRVHRLDSRQETRRSLILILLMGLATLSIMGTTRALFVDKPGPTLPYAQQ